MKILILPIIIFIAIFFVVLGKQRSKKSTMGYGSIRFKKTVVYIFLVILILSLPILYLLPRNKLIKNGIDGNKLREQIDKEDFGTLYNEGKLDTATTLIKQKNYSFDIKSNAFYINQMENSFVEIIGEEKQEADGKIDVEIYTYKSSFNNIDVTKYQAVPIAMMVNNTLVIEKANDTTFNYKQFNNNFTTIQFTKGDPLFHSTFDSVSRPGIVLIRYPKGVSYLKEK